MKKIFKIAGIFFVFNEWTIVVDDDIFQKIKEYKMNEHIFLLDSDNKVVTKAIFTNHLKLSQNGRLSIGLIINSDILKEEIKKSVSFVFEKDLI